MISRSQARSMLFAWLDGAITDRGAVTRAMRLLPEELAATLWLHVEDRGAIDWHAEELAVDKLREALACVGVR